MNTKALSFTLIFLAAASFAAADEPNHGRVSYADASALVKGTGDADWSYATVNSLVLPGDSIWADETGAVEVELPGGAFIRLADGSRMDVVDMPPAANLKGVTGAFYIQRLSRSTGSLTFETAGARIDIDPDSQVRFDVLSEGSTTVSVRWGRAFIHSAGGAPVELGQGYRSFIDPGYLPSAPAPFDRSIEDDFDSWNRERARLLAVGTENVPIVKTSDTSYPVGVSDLNSYGDWVYTDDNYYWRPTVVHDYVPYRHGYWTYIPSQGYCWVDNYPFAYITTHYGYWNYNDRYGWLWGYRPQYRPAYAATIHCGDYFVWAPLNPYGYPVTYGQDYYSFGGVNFSIYSSSCAPVYDVLYGGCYVRPFSNQYVSNIHADNVFIWNINYGSTGRRGSSDAFFNAPSLRVRDYSPRRVMRGTETAGTLTSTAGTTVNARTRVASLEQRAAIPSRVSTNRSVRDANSTVTTTERQVPSRSIRLASDTVSRTRESAERAGVTSRNTRALMSRQGEVPNIDSENARDVTPIVQPQIRARNAAENATRTPASNRFESVPGADAPRSTSQRNVRQTIDAATESPSTPSSSPRVTRSAPTVTRAPETAPSRSTRSAFTNTDVEVTRPVPRATRETVPANEPIVAPSAPTSRATRFSDASPSVRVERPAPATTRELAPERPAPSPRISEPSRPAPEFSPRVAEPSRPSRFEAPQRIETPSRIEAPSRIETPSRFEPSRAPEPSNRFSEPSRSLPSPSPRGNESSLRGGFTAPSAPSAPARGGVSRGPSPRGNRR